jgi:hypothetical protein
MRTALLVLVLLVAGGCSTISMKDVDPADRSRVFQHPSAEVFAALREYCAEAEYEIESADSVGGILQTAYKFYSPEVTFTARKKFKAELKPRPDGTAVYLTLTDEMKDIKTSRWHPTKMTSGIVSGKYIEIFDGIGAALARQAR